jgi:hypothetical protein
MITHVDSFWRLRMVRKALHTTDFGICLSKDTLNFLAEKGVPAQQLRAITPGYDGDIKPRRVVIGLTTHLYPNKCKREDVLLEVCQKRRLDDFRFVIFGNGWEPVLPVLLDAGAEVEHTPGTQDYLADYQKIKAAVPFFDYYLYMGLDEGSMGILDALAAGVPTIVTPQGFHLDIPGGITNPFWDACQLGEIFDRIVAQRRQRVESVSKRSWHTYAQEHARIWHALIDGEKMENPEALSQPSSIKNAPAAVQRSEKILYYMRPMRNLWLKRRNKD